MMHLELTTQELLIQESALSRAHKIAQNMLEQGVEVDVSHVITTALAKAIPFITDNDVQAQVTQMLVESTAANVVLKANIGAQVKTIGELESEITNLAAEREIEELDSIDGNFAMPTNAEQEYDHVDHLIEAEEQQDDS